MTVKGPPNPEGTMTFGYDNLNRLTSANKAGINLSFTWDALSRNLTLAIRHDIRAPCYGA